VKNKADTQFQTKARVYSTTWLYDTSPVLITLYYSRFFIDTNRGTCQIMWSQQISGNKTSGFVTNDTKPPERLSLNVE